VGSNQKHDTEEAVETENTEYSPAAPESAEIQPKRHGILILKAHFPELHDITKVTIQAPQESYGYRL
jgi:hypothetical protein